MDKIVLKTIADIKSLKIQGARNIAIAALDTLELIVKKRGFGREFLAAADALQKSRPTAVPLFNTIEMVKIAKTPDTLRQIKSFFDIATLRVAENGADLIKKNVTILTHCHSSEAVLAMKRAKKRKQSFRVIVTETRPKLQGLITAKELLAEKIPVSYIVDSAAGYYMDDLNIAIFGCDSIRPEGIYNKIGTYLLALACFENKIPVYFIGNSLKIDRRKTIDVEMRPAEEIIPPKKLRGAKILNPAFDCTPWEFISGIVTERGVFRKWGKLIN